MILNVVGLFCEDIREEKSGQFTLIGILPDNVLIPSRPEGVSPTAAAIVPKLALYIRIHLSVDEDVERMTVKLLMPDGKEIMVEAIDSEIVKLAKKQAAATGVPIAGLIQHSVLQGFQIPGPGVILAVLDTPDERRPCAVLNFVEAEPASKTETS